MVNKRMKWWKRALILIAMLSLWTFIVCFPNPFIAVRNVIRYVRLPVDPSVVELIDVEIPDEPAEIEKLVLEELVIYQWDWKNYGSPDYVATARQAVTRGSGDCEDRAVVLASLFEAKNIPYDLKASLVHYWVDYPGKKASRGENEKVAFFGKKDGKFRLKLPDMGQWRRYFNSGKEGLWDVMPRQRKILMIAGWVMIAAYIFSRRRETVVSDEQPSSQHQ